mmetsp:Transcript_7275/g.13580  ORF Transcript_7275/g.13580 Transcript_7275/m.13580 type:complete len:520 (-) Transcript_7275:258-1817(-)
MKTLNAEDQTLIETAICDSSSVNPLSGSSGQWAFGGKEVNEREAFFCPHPFAPDYLAIPTSSYHGDNVARCNTLYSQLVFPHHLAACLCYICMSLVFVGIFGYYAYVMHLRRDMHLKVTGKTKPMEKVYVLGALAAFANGLACVDMKGWAGVYTLAAQQVLVELSAGFLHCALFILMTMWISISQTKNSRNRTIWLERLQYFCGAVSILAGCTLGYLEWEWSEDPTHGSKNGSFTAAKHASLGLMELTYSAAGSLMALQLLRRIRKSSQSMPLERGHGRNRSCSSVGVMKVRQLQKISYTITSYLCAVTVTVAGMVWYRFDKAVDSWGTETYRHPPCSTRTAWVFFSPITVLVFLLIFAIVGAPAKGEAPPRQPTSDTSRFQALNPFSKSKNKQSGEAPPQGEEQWNSVVKNRLNEREKDATPPPPPGNNGSPSNSTQRPLAVTPPSQAHDDCDEDDDFALSEQQILQRHSARAGSTLTNENDTRPSQWTDWSMDEPTIAEAQETIAAGIEAANSNTGL